MSVDVRGGRLFNECWGLDRGGCVVTRSLRLAWPQNGLGSGQETNRRAVSGTA